LIATLYLVNIIKNGQIKTIIAKYLHFLEYNNLYFWTGNATRGTWVYPKLSGLSP